MSNLPSYEASRDGWRTLPATRSYKLGFSIFFFFFARPFVVVESSVATEVASEAAIDTERLLRGRDSLLGLFEPARDCTEGAGELAWTDNAGEVSATLRPLFGLEREKTEAAGEDACSLLIRSNAASAGECAVARRTASLVPSRPSAGVSID